MPNAQCLLPFNLQRMKPYTFLLFFSSLGYTRQATTMQKAFQRLLAPFWAPLGSDFGACRQSPSGVTSVLQRQKIGPRTALGSGPVHMALQPSGINFVLFSCRLATCLGPISHPRCDFSKPQAPDVSDAWNISRSVIYRI